MKPRDIRTAVIMAAGLGLRINQHIDDKPKGFIQIDGVALIERAIRILSKYGINRFIIGIGYQAGYYEKLAEVFPNIELKKNPIYDQTSSFYTLFNLRDLIKENFLLLESDLLFEEKAIEFLLQTEEHNVVLASGWTHSQDEVYIETDSGEVLVGMSKDKNALSHLFGELVGITKLSYKTFQKICEQYENDETRAKQIDYETALSTISPLDPIHVAKIEDLVWTEIDMVSHLNRARDVIYPAIKAKEGKNPNIE